MQEADQHRIIISGKYWRIGHVLISFAGGKLLRSLAVRLLHKTAQGFFGVFQDIINHHHSKFVSTTTRTIKYS